MRLPEPPIVRGLPARPGTRKRSHGANAVITGAGSGIGRAFALELANRRSSVVVSDIDLAAAKRTAEQITLRGGSAHGVQCDVTSLAEVEQLAAAAEEFFGGHANLVINNAGIGAGGTYVGETDLGEWKRVLDVNLWGVIHGCHVFIPRLDPRGGVINVASAASFGCLPGMAAYNASKAAVLAISETMAAEGVHTTVLCPTFVKTAIVERGEIPSATKDRAANLMRVAGISPDRIARNALDAHDRGHLHVVPQVEAQLIWRTKRLAPGIYTRAAGVAGRFLKTETAEDAS
ncbi:MAG TPA: SDR family NAD(P)-dependent oxidoreductase [Sporichthya sp.]|jgi:NAD(P)-dependent dehydrogenase (short-subunit alcohol dehydrogenase family)|nr:SDR family NAD(P)-dependent oxidoreductase [Sporichthya sp.]